MSEDESIDLDSEDDATDEHADEEVITETSEALASSDSSSSLAQKEQERRRIQAEIEAFLAAGGKINTVSSNVVADPPKKPQSSYGSQPI